MYFISVAALLEYIAESHIHFNLTFPGLLFHTLSQPKEEFNIHTYFILP